MVRVLDVLEDYLRWMRYSYERIDGHVKGNDRQVVPAQRAATRWRSQPPQGAASRDRACAHDPHDTQST
eukprot:4839966-Prymnesium_polylepis.1